MTEDIEVSREGAVLSAAFARPQKKNAITGAMYEKLIQAFEEAGRDPEIGALVLSGKGGVFTAGNDLNDFLAVAMHETGEFPAWRFVQKLSEFEKPLVAAVDGLAIGVGTTLCFHCDLVYATPQARFQTPFVNLGLVPEAGSSLLAPQRFGRAKAAEFFMLAEPFGAEEALETRPRQRAPASGQAFGPCDGKGGHARRQAKSGPARDAPPHARRRRGGEGADGGGDARFLGRAEEPRGACGVPGLSVGAVEIAHDIHEAGGASPASAVAHFYFRFRRVFR